MAWSTNPQTRFGFYHPGDLLATRLQAFLSMRAPEWQEEIAGRIEGAVDTLLSALEEQSAHPLVAPGDDQRPALAAAFRAKLDEFFREPDCACPACTMTLDEYLASAPVALREPAKGQAWYDYFVEAHEEGQPLVDPLSAALRERLSDEDMTLLISIMLDELAEPCCPLGPLYLDGRRPDRDLSLVLGTAQAALRRYVAQQGAPAEPAALIGELASCCTPADFSWSRDNGPLAAERPALDQAIADYADGVTATLLERPVALALAEEWLRLEQGGHTPGPSLEL